MAACVMSVLLLGSASIQAKETGPIKEHPAFLPLDKYIDLKTIEPTVNVNLPKFLLNNMLSELSEGGEDPFGEVGIQIKDLVKDIRLIRVMVFELGNNKDSSTAKGKLKKGIDQLQSEMNDNWLPIAKVPEANVGIFAMGDESDERMIGLAMTVVQDDVVVIGNIVGEISIGKIVKLGTTVYGATEGGQSGPPPMEELLKMLGVMPPQGGPDSPPAEPDGDAETIKSTGGSSE